MRWFHIRKPPYTPDIDHDALKEAQEHVAKERREADQRWNTVRAIVQPLRERSDRNGLAEAILANRKARRA